MAGRYHMIVQARMESERLPGKILKKFAGQPMLLMQLDRLARCQDVDNLVIATTNTSENIEMAAKLTQHGYTTFIALGRAEDDVLGRYWDCFKWIEREEGMSTDDDYIVRVTGDCPLIDPEVIDDVILLNEEYDLDYVALSQHWPDGLDVEIISAIALRKMYDVANDGYEKEHVTPLAYIRGKELGIKGYSWPCPYDLSGHNWSVDDIDDYHFLSQVVELTIRKYGHNFGWRDVYGVLRLNQTWLENATRKPRNSSFMKQVGIDSTWEDLRYRKSDDDVPNLPESAGSTSFGREV